MLTTRTAGESIFPALEPLLERVSKPIQYVGGELNSTVKDWQCGGYGPGGEELTARWALMYPDAYEVGVPNQGVMILYEVLNERPDALAERTYAVWPDLEALLRESGVPQFTVDGHRPIRDFDVLGLSFATELGYTNMLTALDLAGIPLHAADRGDDDPIVLAGGHAAFNPEPVADFIDAAVIGDGEQAVLTITDLITAWKGQGRPGGRAELLLRLARTGGVYVPSLYDVDYLPDGRIKRVAPRAGTVGVPWRVSKHTVMDLDAWPYPKQPLVPLAESVHERMSVEIFRGCTRGCRFCQAGMITRPVRERSITGIGEMVERGLAATGFEEVGLLSLSSADHSEIAELTKGLADRYEGTQTGLSLPSTRVDAFNIDLANELTRNGRRSGLTFAPEGGSERIRKVINKMVTEDDLIATVAAAYGAGWRQVKLYFMCGLPTETDEDVLQIADLAKRVIETGRRVSGRRDIRCTVSIGGFVPKPHTPFQWTAQLGVEATDARLAKLRDAIRADRRYASSIGFRYHDGQPGLIEGLLSRGDRRVGKVIEAVWRDGGRFDGWSEHFSYERWITQAERVFAEDPECAAVDVAWFTTRERELVEVLPWDHLDSGLDKDWLWEDWQ
ncbi:MAG: TIGR03960 family B12-binding radical SAM protein, partial [Lapillicoccus sp.]